MKKRVLLLKKADFRWLRSYFIVVLAIITVLMAYSLIMITQVRNDADENNRRFASYYNTAMEKSLKSLQDYSSTLIYSETAKKMHVYDTQTVNTPEALYNAYDLVYDIRNFVLANGMLDDIYLYYPENDQIIGRRGSFSSYAYFKTENVNMLPLEKEYQQWMQTLFQNKRAGFYTYTSPEGQHSIYYFQDAIYGESGNDYRMLVAKISGDLLDASIQELVSSSACNFAGLVDGDGMIYAEAGNKTPFIDKAGAFSFLKSSDRYIVYEVKSSLWPLSFVTVQDFSSAYRIVKLSTSTLILGTIIAAVVGVSLAAYFANRNKSAVDKIANRFENDPSLARQNAFDYIGTEIDKLMMANHNAINAAEQQQKIIASFFLKELLHKKNCTEKDVDHLCAMYQISLENALFSLVIARPCGQERDLDQEAIRNFVEAAVDDNFIVYWTQMDKDAVFLCNYESRTKSPQGPVLEFAKQMRERCQCDVQISPVMYSSREISMVWEAMKPQAMSASEQPISRKNEDAGLIVLREFNDAVDHDDLTAAIALVPELSSKFIDCVNSNLTLCRKYTLLGKLYETYDTEQMQQKIDAVLSVADTVYWEQQLIALLQKLDQDVNRKVDMRQVAEIARDMIHREYNNPQLGLQMIAEHIGVSQSYLSRLFKGKYGMSVIQYLNYIRVEQAKKQILAGSDNLKVIAMNVGFSSDVNLIRVFKKFENTTPGNFRNRE